MAHHREAAAMSDSGKHEILEALTAVLKARASDSPQDSYVSSLYARPDKMLKKIGEEATETILAAKNGDRKALVHETADLWFHSLVLLAHHDLSYRDVLAELQRRFGVSGHAEKAARKPD